MSVSVICPDCGKSREISEVTFQRYEGIAKPCVPCSHERVRLKLNAEAAAKGKTVPKTLYQCACGNMAYDVKCAQCKDKEVIAWPCPECGKVRHVSKGYTDNNPGKLCSDCTRIADPEKFRARYEKRKDNRQRQNTSRISINGCLLVKARAGRCSDYSHCRHGAHANLYDIPREEDCCYQAGQLNWDGWVCRTAHPDIVTAEEERSLFRADRPSIQGMCLENFAGN
jgi:hypothetical protein